MNQPLIFHFKVQTHKSFPHLQSESPTIHSLTQMDFLHVSAATIFALLFFFYALFTIPTRFVSRRKNLPPEAGGGWPVIGHLHQLSGKEPAHTTLGKMADAHGPIFMLKLGTHRALVVSGWEIARECFTTNDKKFASRPKLAAAKLLGYEYAMFGTSPYGSHWKHVRKIATLEVLANHRLEKLQHIRRSEVESSIKRLHELCVNKKVLVEMKAWFGEVTLNTIFRMVVGKRFSTAFEGSSGEQYQKALRDFLYLFGAFVPSDSFPFLSWLDLGGYEKAMKKTAKVLDEVLEKWLTEHKQRRISSGMEMDQGLDFMDVMLSTVKDEEFSDYDADTVTKATCLALILGGFDTTTTELTWGLSLLLNDEGALKKVQFELDEHVGRERQVEDSDMKNLIYLQAVVKETLRMYPAAPLSVPHESLEDVTVAGYYVSAGTRLLVNLHKLQRDPLVWENPNEFCPERFLTSQKNFDVKGQNPQLIPFGAGRRICPGMSFAIQAMYLILAKLLHEFDICRPSEEPLNMEESVGLNNTKKTPLQVIITPRLSVRVYE
ncbi:cytochrome P450 CYP82D47-like [Momordica charantia]|uniref:Cytochrome P450 CYP82D47-like n=1 Tax=Momordica charantia TaxID=3673 RepID=A0A6J1C8S8_MOMCH|nr:cytochrome P450 CYP82D47-like [Momordica charantia]